MYVCMIVHQDKKGNGLQHYTALGGDVLGEQQMSATVLTAGYCALHHIFLGSDLGSVCPLQKMHMLTDSPLPQICPS